MRGTAVLVTPKTIEEVFSKVVQAINDQGYFRENPLDASSFVRQPRELCVRTGLIYYPFVRSSEANVVSKIVLAFSKPDEQGNCRLSAFTREYADGSKRVTVPVTKSPRYRLP